MLEKRPQGVDDLTDENRQQPAAKSLTANWQQDAAGLLKAGQGNHKLQQHPASSTKYRKALDYNRHNTNNHLSLLA